MCFSFAASTCAAIFELTCFIIVANRAYRSKTQEVRDQLLMLPMLASVIAIELIETILWWRSEELESIHVSDATRCSAHNRNLTLTIWTAVLPWQPLWAIFACRRSGTSRNQELLRVPEFLAFLFGFVCATSFLFANFLPEEPRFRKFFRSTKNTSYLNYQTCTYIGKTGSLHWTIKALDYFMTPNAFTYVLLWTSVAFARPWRLFSGIMMLMLIILSGLLLDKHGSFESGSEWCFSALILFIWLVVQPWAFPYKSIN